VGDQGTKGQAKESRVDDAGSLAGCGLGVIRTRRQRTGSARPGMMLAADLGEDFLWWVRGVRSPGWRGDAVSARRPRPAAPRKRIVDRTSSRSLRRLTELAGQGRPVAARLLPARHCERLGIGPADCAAVIRG